VSGSREWFLTFNQPKSGIRFYDFTINELKIIIEYNGIAFHPREFDFEWKSAYGKLYEESYNRDLEKLQLAESYGYEVIYVWSDEDLKESVQELTNYIFNKYIEKTENNEQVSLCNFMN
jgi:very-short-patch-repair endonuclease